MEQEIKMLKFREDHQKHKDDAQDALEYYWKLSVEMSVKYAQIWVRSIVLRLRMHY